MCNARTSDSKYDKPIPASRLTWSVPIADPPGGSLNYGEMHALIHRDISIGNDYRKERIKHLITLATAVFALALTFHKDLFASSVTVPGLIMMVLGWLSLLASLAAGAVHLGKWEDYYLEHRAVGNAIWRHHSAKTDEDEKRAARVAFHKARENVDALQVDYKLWNKVQIGCLLFGMAMFAGYVTYSTSLLLPSAESTNEGAAGIGEAAGEAAGGTLLEVEPADKSVEPPDATNGR